MDRGELKKLFLEQRAREASLKNEADRISNENIGQKSNQSSKKKTCLNVAVVGGVDTGKTTFTLVAKEYLSKIGLLLEEGIAKSYEDNCHKGEDGHTDWPCSIYYSLNKHNINHIDCPGREHLIKQTIEQLIECDAAVLVVDADKGPNSETRQFISLFRSMNIEQFVVFFNKWDLNDSDSWNQRILNELRAMLVDIEIDPDTIKVFTGSSTDYLKAKTCSEILDYIDSNFSVREAKSSDSLLLRTVSITNRSKNSVEVDAQICSGYPSIDQKLTKLGTLDTYIIRDIKALQDGLIKLLLETDETNPIVYDEYLGIDYEPDETTDSFAEQIEFDGTLSDSALYGIDEVLEGITTIDEYLQEYQEYKDDFTLSALKDHMSFYQALCCFSVFRQHVLNDDDFDGETYYPILDKVDTYIEEIEDRNNESIYLYYIANLYSIHRFKDVDPNEKFQEFMANIPLLDESECVMSTKWWEEVYSDTIEYVQENILNNSSSDSYGNGRSAIEEKLREIVIDKLFVEDWEIERSSTFDDLGMDSLDAVELIMEIEKEFGISIPDSRAERFRTFGDILDYVQNC